MDDMPPLAASQPLRPPAQAVRTFDRFRADIELRAADPL
jgi:hypothetical protein